MTRVMTLLWLTAVAIAAWRASLLGLAVLGVLLLLEIALRLAELQAALAAQAQIGGHVVPVQSVWLPMRDRERHGAFVFPRVGR